MCLSGPRLLANLMPLLESEHSVCEVLFLLQAFLACFFEAWSSLA